MHIKATRPCNVNASLSLGVGQVVEVPDNVGSLLIQLSKAVRVAPATVPPPIPVVEPVVEAIVEKAVVAPHKSATKVKHK